MKKKCQIFWFLFILGSICFADSEGEKAFKQNNPTEAAFLLENEISAGTASSAAYNYLGLSYFQLGDYAKSVEAFNKGLGVPGTNKKLLAYNQGNSYYAMRDFNNAAKSFSLSLSADPSFYNALLNRANSYLMADSLENALADYKRYIIVVPNDPQKESIIKLISALEAEMEKRAVEKELAAKEAERMAEEEKRMQAEMERMRIEDEKRAAEERKLREQREAEERAKREAEEAERQRIENERRAAEAERRRKMLEDVANSLHNTDSTNMSAGAEDLIDMDQEAELD